MMNLLVYPATWTFALPAFLGKLDYLVEVPFDSDGDHISHHQMTLPGGLEQKIAVSTDPDVLDYTIKKMKDEMKDDGLSGVLSARHVNTYDVPYFARFFAQKFKRSIVATLAKKELKKELPFIWRAMQPAGAVFFNRDGTHEEKQKAIDDAVKNGFEYIGVFANRSRKPKNMAVKTGAERIAAEMHLPTRYFGIKYGCRDPIMPRATIFISRLYDPIPVSISAASGVLITAPDGGLLHNQHNAYVLKQRAAKGLSLTHLAYGAQELPEYIMDALAMDAPSNP